MQAHTLFPTLNLDPAYLDAAYNNRALVPSHATHLQAWAECSAAAREQFACTTDIAYGASAAEKLDVFTAPGSSNPVMVYVHGGWFRGLDKADHSFVAPIFTQAGVTVVVPNYALAPAVTVETIVLQVAHSIAWTYWNIAQYGGNPERIYVVGHSAGGQLAAMMLCCQWKTLAATLPKNLVKGAVAISGLFEMESVRHTPMLKADLQLTAESALRLSPALMPAPSAPLLAFVGADESAEFLRQNALIEQAWGTACVRQREALIGLQHFSVLEALVQPRHRLHQATLSLLKGR
jgi:arylformamidase